MSNVYKVVIKTDSGVQTVHLQGTSETVVLNSLANTGVTVVAVEPLQPTINVDQMPQLMTASLALMLCIVALVVAEYKIRMWLKN